MSEFYTSKRVVALALAVGLGSAAAGCGGSDETPKPKPTKIKITCQAQMPEQWQHTPSNLNASAIAGRLGVSEAQVRNGAFGGAACERAISPQEIDSNTILDIKNIGNTCLAIGLQSEIIAPSNNVLAVCAAAQ